MRKTIFLWGLVILIAAMAPRVFAGKVELTTYYPAPYGEYKEVKASDKITIPVKTVGDDPSGVSVGEIWVEG